MRLNPWSAASLVLAMTLGSAGVATAQTLEEPTAKVREIMVSGRLQGPPLWQVSKGEHKLMLFGLPDVVPDKLQWNPAKVEKVLAQTEVILGQPGARSEASIGPFKAIGLIRQYRKLRKLDNKQSLDELVNPQLFVRITALQKLYGPRGSGLHKLRPFLVAAKLTEAAMQDSDLSGAGTINKRIAKLIKKAKLEEVKSLYAIEAEPKALMKELDATPWEEEVQCLATVVETLESDIRNQRERAISWSYGEMAEIYAQDYPDPGASCMQALMSSGGFNAILAGANALWLSNAELVLEQYRVSFGMISMRELLADDGLLAQLEARGYVVHRP